MNSDTIYLVAKEHLGERLTLNPNIPEEVGCVEAVSFILKSAGYPIPQGGIAGVNALIAWLLQNGFVELDYPTVGGIITAHQSDAENPNFAHCGVVLRYGIGSNDSTTGLFSENYSLSGWLNSFTLVHNSATRYFAAKV